MGVEGKEIIAALILLLLSISVVGQTTIFAAKDNAPFSWEGELGFYLPFILFTFVSTYHFGVWAIKHKRNALLLMLLIVGVASLIGSTSLNIPMATRSVRRTSFSANPTVTEEASWTQGTQSTVSRTQSKPTSSPESVVKLWEALERTPYSSMGFNVLIIGATAVALIVVVLRMRPEKRQAVSVALTERAATTEIRGTSPREVIVYSYRVATVALQADGVHMPDSDTPIEVLRRIERSRPMVAHAFDKLTELFEEARFSAHMISEADARHASLFCDSIEQTI